MDIFTSFDEPVVSGVLVPLENTHFFIELFPSLPYTIGATNTTVTPTSLNEIDPVTNELIPGYGYTNWETKWTPTELGTYTFVVAAVDFAENMSIIDPSFNDPFTQLPIRILSGTVMPYYTI